MKTLSNRDISNLSKHVETYEEKVLEGLYDHHKSIISFIQSGAMKGEAGEATVTYLTNVHLYLINKFMNVVSELASDMKHIEEAFLAYETSNYGIVNSSLVNSKQTEIKQIFNQFDTLDNELNTLTSEINYIPGVSSLKSSVLINEFNKTFDKMDDIVDNLEEKDLNLTNHLESLSARVQELKMGIKDVEAHFKTDGGFSSEKVSNIEASSWYTNESFEVMTELYKNSPFVVENFSSAQSANEVGFVTDLGTNIAGAYVNRRGYSLNVDENVAHFNGYVSGFEARNDFKSNYQESESYVKVMYAEIDASLDKGINITADVGAAQAEVDYMVGFENWNAHVAAEGGHFTANGKIRADTGGLGLKGEIAPLFYGELVTGITVFGTDIDVGMNAGKIGGGFEVSWDKIELSLAKGLGLNLTIDFPW
jgi:conjugal transfer/entry exclusion protein